MLINKDNLWAGCGPAQRGREAAKSRSSKQTNCRGRLREDYVIEEYNNKCLGQNLKAVNK